MLIASPPHYCSPSPLPSLALASAASSRSFFHSRNAARVVSMLSKAPSRDIWRLRFKMATRVLRPSSLAAASSRQISSRSCHAASVFWVAACWSALLSSRRSFSPCNVRARRMKAVSFFPLTISLCTPLSVYPIGPMMAARSLRTNPPKPLPTPLTKPKVPPSLAPWYGCRNRPVTPS